MFGQFDCIEIGSSPCEENCVQVDSKSDYLPAMREECRRFKSMLEKRFPIPESLEGKAWFFIQSNPHDFGSYLEVAVKFDTDDSLALQFALFVERNTPSTWSDEQVLVFEPEKVEE